MDKFLRIAKKEGAEYSELRTLEATRTNIEVTQKEVKDLSSGDVKMFSARVLAKGGWGIAYSYKEDYESLIKAAIKNATRVDERIAIESLKPNVEKIKTAFKTNPADIALEDKRALALKMGRKGFDNIVNTRIIYSDSRSNYHFVNSEGSDITWDDCTVGFLAWAFAKNGDDMQNFLKIERVRGGYEVTDKAEETLNEAVKKAQALLKAKYAKGGIFPVIADQKLAGVFAHEAVGHACEADLVLSHSSILVDKVGQKIGNDIINICDDGKREMWGWTPFDSEGVKASKTCLIEKGVLTGYLHSRDTAPKFNAEPTGNGRSQGLSFKVIPRMTNTIIEAGDSSFEEIISGVKKGYYLKGCAGGQVDPAGGEFLFNAQEGYYVENGEIKHMVKGCSLIGSILETLHNINLIAKDVEFGTGYCGKSGQVVPVSEASPHILIDNARVGGAE
jgi:TldD protein